MRESKQSSEGLTQKWTFGTPANRKAVLVYSAAFRFFLRRSSYYSFYCTCDVQYLLISLFLMFQAKTAKILHLWLVADTPLYDVYDYLRKSKDSSPR